MSYREIRNFCESLRSLGYHRLVSIENFSTANFELVADLLDWLLRRFDPTISISDDISDEAHRISFIREATEQAVLRTGVKLNARKLYGADGYAVKELLKLSTLLYGAQQSLTDGGTEQGLSEDDSSFALNSKLHDLKTTRGLCSSIVESGATLFDLLGKEVTVQPEREKALQFLDGISRNLGSNSEHNVVERALTNMLESHTTKLDQLQTMASEMQKDEKNLESKIKKKKQELDRTKKRLASLSAVRPAFMDEYEHLEQELVKNYDQYINRFRNLDFIEHELDALNQEEQDKMEENERAMKKLQKRLREEEWRLLRGEGDEAGEEGGSRRPKERGPNSKAMKGNKAGFGGGKDGGLGGGGRGGGGLFSTGDDEDVLSDDSTSESEPISVGKSSNDSQSEKPISLGASGDEDDDILEESDSEHGESSQEDLVIGANLGAGRSGMKGMSNHDF